MEGSALQLLAYYGNDGESSDEDVPGPNVSTKRRFKEEVRQRLPVPECMKKIDSPTWIDDPSEHQGRIRSFKHERGNWATFVYVPCESHNGITSLQESIIKCIPEVPIQKVEDLHLSLSKTVILKYHWIHPFMNSIKERISHYRRFVLTIGNLKVYCNEEKTRTFIGLEVTSAHDTLHALIKELDICLSEFKLPPFYQDPSFHISILWCVGDLQSKLDSYLPHFNLMLNKVMTEYSEQIWYIPVNYLFCKTGNKKFQFPLD
ncbi:U6 snRNA phosphodiesterase [Coccinella septempunctata]|uniref:U6 snRNA phosphodiesterase n=1 Tax=Coccinella septempunctata TaxID=41139 RepID=UPI001D071FF9|nr:U6 snRNA phosphodiesterase [Coccinella septempunctata]